jgi:hypothetical protein
LGRNPEGKKPLGRPRSRWVENNKNKTDLGEIGCCVIDYICLAPDRGRLKALVNKVMNLRVPKITGRFSSSFTTGGLSLSDQFHRVN